MRADWVHAPIYGGMKGEGLALSAVEVTPFVLPGLWLRNAVYDVTGQDTPSNE